MGGNMETHVVLRTLGAFGTLMGTYNAVTSGVPFEDLAVIFLVSITLYVMGREIKVKKEGRMKISLPMEELKGGICIHATGN